VLGTLLSPPAWAALLLVCLQVGVPQVSAIVINFTGNVTLDFPSNASVASDGAPDVFFPHRAVLSDPLSPIVNGPTGWDIVDVNKAVLGGPIGQAPGSERYYCSTGYHGTTQPPAQWIAPVDTLWDKAGALPGGSGGFQACAWLQQDLICVSSSFSNSRTPTPTPTPTASPTPTPTPSSTAGTAPSTSPTPSSSQSPVVHTVTYTHAKPYTDPNPVNHAHTHTHTHS
jgi:hypothetical protein